MFEQRHDALAVGAERGARFASREGRAPWKRDRKPRGGSSDCVSVKQQGLVERDILKFDHTAGVDQQREEVGIVRG